VPLGHKNCTSQKNKSLIPSAEQFIIHEALLTAYCMLALKMGEDIAEGGGR
jgi:hypothetical protein